jgi:hypothetical protein
MAVAAHLAELTEKHRVLDQRIEEEAARPASNPRLIAKLKFEKLKLKDQIAKLSDTRH